MLAAVAMVAPAQAAKPDNGGKAQAGPRDPTNATSQPKKGRCAPRSVGFNASGTLVSSALTPGEPRRFDGTLVVNVTRANHGAPKGEQTYTLADARVSSVAASTPPRPPPAAA